MASSFASGRGSLSIVALSLLSTLACSSSEDTTPTNPGDGGPSDDAGGSSGSLDGAPDGGFDPSRHEDPQDVDPTNGDPSLDIAGSWIYFDNGQPWVRVELYGSWPPPATLASWSCAVLLGTANAPVATYTMQSSAGTQSEYAEGIDKAKISFAAEPKGFRVMFADPALAFDRYGIECHVKKTASGPSAEDASGSFEVKTREPRTFGP